MEDSNNTYNVTSYAYNIEEYNQTRDIEDRGRVCHAPFKSIRFEQRGLVRACCYNRKVVLGQYPQQSIHEIWNGNIANEFRKQIEQNDLSNGCDYCLNKLNNKEYYAVKTKQYDNFGSPVSNYPLVVDFSLHNTCNLECVMCHAEFSTSILKNRDKLPLYRNAYDEEFVEQLVPYIIHAKQFVFAGGEPFMMDLYFDIWQKIILLNPTAAIDIVTNGTRYNTRIKQILSGLKASINVSIDSLNKTNYEAIRKNAVFDETMNNVEVFYNYCLQSGTNFGMSVCPIKQNRWDIAELIQYCNKKSILLTIHTITNAEHATLKYLSAAELHQLVSFYQNFHFPVTTLIEKKNAAMFHDFVLQLKAWYKEAAEGTSQNNETEIEKNFAEESYISGTDFIKNLMQWLNEYGHNQAAEKLKTIVNNHELESVKISAHRYREMRKENILLIVTNIASANPTTLIQQIKSIAV